MHKLSEEEIDKCRKRFLWYRKPQISFSTKNRRGRKKSNWIKKCVKLKKFHDSVDSVDDHYDAADDDKYRKIGSIKRLFEGFDRDYYKPIRTDYSVVGKKNIYIEYTSRWDRNENLSPEKYLDMIRQYLRDLWKKHKPTI